jgi:hypothetical protein
MTLRGLDFLSAATIVAELGDLRRFAHPKDLMGYLGLVPSEHSSGPRQHRGELTRTGNTHVRRILIEAAWSYRFPARVESSGAAVRALPPLASTGSSSQQGDRSNCTGVVWVYLVHWSASGHEQLRIAAHGLRYAWRIGNAATGRD